jgi:hypothetical protein
MSLSQISAALKSAIYSYPSDVRRALSPYRKRYKERNKGDNSLTDFSEDMATGKKHRRSND